MQSQSNKKIMGFDYENNFENFEEINYEKSDFIELNRDLKINPKKQLITIDSDDIELEKNKISNKNLFSNKKININNFKGKIIHFKDSNEKLQNNICQALINEWPNDFSLKKNF